MSRSSNERIIPIRIEGQGNQTTDVDHLNVSLTNTELSTDDGSDTMNRNDYKGSPKQKGNSVSTQNVTHACESNESERLELPERTLPSYNVPEKIIIVLDRAQEDQCNFFEVGATKVSPLTMLKRSLEIFLYNKSLIDVQHQFALVVLNQTGYTWIHDFTNTPQDIISSLDAINICPSEDIFNLNVVFDRIMKQVTPEQIKPNLAIPPSSVTRIILLYGRSYCIPQLTETHELREFLESPYVTVDVIMTHDPPSSANNFRKIDTVLRSLQPKGFGYNFSVSRNHCELYLSMAKLLSHPFQRPHQSAAKYDLNLGEE